MRALVGWMESGPGQGQGRDDGMTDLGPERLPGLEAQEGVAGRTWDLGEGLCTYTQTP